MHDACAPSFRLLCFPGFFAALDRCLVRVSVDGVCVVYADLGGGSVLCGPAGGGVEQGGKNGRGKTVGRARVGGLPEEAATGDWLDEAAEAEAEDRLEAAGGWDAPDGQDGPVQGLHWLTRGGVGWMTIGRRAGMCRRRCIQRWSAGRVAGYPPHYR